MKIASRRLLPLVVLAALLLTACSSTVAGTAAPGTVAAAGSPSGSSSGSGTPTATDPADVPAGLEKFYRQTLDWESCADLVTNEDTKFYSAPSLQCADLTVPLSYDDPTGPTIDIKVIRKPATRPADRIGSVVINPGGPGVSGVEYGGYLGAFGVAKDLNQRFDIVGFDPRGVGASTPVIECQTDAERDADRAKTPRTRTQAEIDAANAVTQAYAQGCIDRSGAAQGIDGATFLANVGTRNVARDMDVLRAALGDRQLTYLGWSYGTAIGTSYAEQFPTNVRAMILDGAVDPQEDSAESSLGQAEGFQQAFDDFAAWCAGQDRCALGDDPAKATASYQALTRPLLDEPLELADGRVLSFQDAVIGTISALYSESLWESLADSLTGLAAGDGSGLMALADSYDTRDADGHYSNQLDGLVVINCADGGSSAADPQKALQDAEKYAAAAPFADSGDPPAALKDSCEFLGLPGDPVPDLSGLQGLPRVLVISTTKDPATPYESGVNLAQALDAALLTVEGTNHTAYLGTGNKCVDRIGNAYLIDLELPADGTTC